MTMPESTRHLTLAELAASGSNRPLPAAAAAHLGDCAACRARSRDAVADGVRFLLARCQPPPGLMDSVFEAIDAEPAPARRGRPAAVTHLRSLAFRGHHGRRRIALAAAAVVLLGAAGAGLVAALRPAGQPGGGAEGGGSGITQAGITLTECSRLRLQVLGRTLLRVSGSDLVLEGNPPLTVTTSAGTQVLQEVGGTAADITDGAYVLVTGQVTGAATAALLVAIMPGTGSAAAQVVSPAEAKPGLAYGRVEDARSTGFTVVTGDGTRVPVTMSASTSVVTAVPSRLSELQAGEGTSVVTSTGPDGTLNALTVEQGELPPAALQALKESLAPSPLPTFPGPGPLPSPLPNASPSGLSFEPLGSLLGGANRPFASLGCDPAAITSVNLLALALAG